MNSTLTDPCELKPSDVEAHLRLDDDGNPWRPLDPDEPSAGGWQHFLREKLDVATAVLKEHSLVSMGIALGAGYVIGRMLAARSSS